jgi:uncharacterized protein (DUF488 family)
VYYVLNRQKAVLCILEKAGRAVHRLELTKWCFLLSREMPSKGGPSFYQFVPYHYGPFSFSLYRETDAMVAEQYLEGLDNKTWALTARPPTPTRNLSRSITNDISNLVQNFKNKSLQELINYIYTRYPFFTVNSRQGRRMQRPVAPLAVYTAGYEGLLIDGFLNMLIQSGIARLIDIRNNPVSRRYGFHKTTLARLCKFLDIEYFHVPELGINSQNRLNLKTFADYQAVFTQYKAVTLKVELDAIDKVTGLVREKPSVLVCMEADPVYCHRTLLAQHIADKTSLPVKHLDSSER